MQLQTWVVFFYLFSIVQILDFHTLPQHQISPPELKLWMKTKRQPVLFCNRIRRPKVLINSLLYLKGIEIDERM